MFNHLTNFLSRYPLFNRFHPAVLGVVLRLGVPFIISGTGLLVMSCYLVACSPDTPEPGDIEPASPTVTTIPMPSIGADIRYTTVLIEGRFYLATYNGNGGWTLTPKFSK